MFRLSRTTAVMLLPKTKMPFFIPSGISAPPGYDTTPEIAIIENGIYEQNEFATNIIDAFSTKTHSVSNADNCHSSAMSPGC